MGAGWLYETARLLLATPRDFLDAHFETPEVKAMMAAWGMHLDFAPDIAGGALFPYLESMANQAFGMVIGAGGADTIIKAMSGLIKAKGGEIRLGQAVTSIETSSGAATGVRLADGTRLAARRGGGRQPSSQARVRASCRGRRRSARLSTPGSPVSAPGRER